MNKVAKELRLRRSGQTPCGSGPLRPHEKDNVRLWSVPEQLLDNFLEHLLDEHDVKRLTAVLSQSNYGNTQTDNSPRINRY